ncbi:MAG: hypothetical protein V3R93_05555, partial [Candidatus Hydrothermarchaeaceae archaeon]
AIAEALLYADQSGLNITITESNASYYTVLLQMANGMKCNKTIELRSGTLRLNLSLENYMALFNGAPIYVRTGGNSTMNITTYTTYPNSTSVDGADIVVSGLEYITAESISGTSGSNGSGYFNYTLDINAEVDTSDSCWRKALLGEYTATATANLTNFYDGTDDESFYIWGIISSSIVPLPKGGKVMDVRVALTDEYGDPIYSENCKSETNVTYDDPYITMDVYQGASLYVTYESGTANDISLVSGKTYYKTDPSFSFNPAKSYTANINVTMPDFMDGSGNITHANEKELTFYDLGVANVSYDPVDGEIDVNITNYGTEALGDFDLVINYSTDNGTTWNICCATVDAPPKCDNPPNITASSPAVRKGSKVLDCDAALVPGNTNLINTTIVGVDPLDEDSTDDSLEVCYGNC